MLPRSSDVAMVSFLRVKLSRLLPGPLRLRLVFWGTILCCIICARSRYLFRFQWETPRDISKSVRWYLARQMMILFRIAF